MPSHNTPPPQERIQIMAALQTWAEKQAGPSADEEGAAPPEAPGAGSEPELQVAPPRRVSPATSSGSSAEMVEMPQAEELEEAEAATAAAAAEAGQQRSDSGGGGASGAAEAGQPQGQVARASSSGAAALQSLLAYAELGRKQGR